MNRVGKPQGLFYIYSINYIYSSHQLTQIDFVLITDTQENEELDQENSREALPLRLHCSLQHPWKKVFSLLKVSKGGPQKTRNDSI